MKIKYTLLFFVMISFSSCTNTQTLGKSPYENEYFQLEYPEHWNLSAIRPTFIKIKIPDPSFDQASIDIVIEKTNLMSPPIIEAMMSDLEILHRPGAEAFVTDMKYSKFSLDGETGCRVNKSNGKRAYFQYIFVLEEELTVVNIRVKTGKNAYAIFESEIDQMLASIQFKNTPREPKRVVIEATEQEFTKDWAAQKAQYSGALKEYEVTKLDSLLFNLKSPNYGFKITDAEIEINTWADFFVWKPETALKDHQIFAFQDWNGEFLNVFRMYMHLGEYDNLRIQEMSEKQLEFLFSKQNGHTIRWLVDYIEEHKFPLNEDIALKRFIYTTTQSYSRARDRKIAHHIPFLINDKVYRLKVENLSVY